MLRTILAVIAGYVILAIIIIVTTILSVRLLLPDADASPTTLYLIVNLILGFFAAWVGGYTTAYLAKQETLTPVYALAALVFILGLLSLGQADGQPSWYQYSLLVIGPLGVIIGGKLQHR